LPELKNVSFFFIIYALFAFLVSFSREIIKDIEDRKGDEEYSCTTIAIAYGDRTAKIIAAAVMILTILLVGGFQQVMMNRGWTAVVWYLAGVVQLPLVYIIIKLFRSTAPPDYHFLGNLSRIVMVAGVLSIQLIYTSL
jgi:4-hydroxybenzoate polyprenyltransferase